MTTLLKTKKKERISILRYSRSDHRFTFAKLPENASDGWRQDHDKWLDYAKCETEGHTAECYHQPSFSSLQDLQEFNNKGRELSHRLKQEFPTLEVEPFAPMYDRLRVSAFSWWHLQDEEYGFPVSIQHLPVSDRLKSDFWLWRSKKDEACLANADEMEEEGKELQRRLYEELHETKSDHDIEHDFSRSFRDYDEEQDEMRRNSW